MNLSDLISNIHWLPVTALTIFSFLLGALWHRPFLFGKAWKIENNPNDIQKKINAPLTFGGTAVMHFIAISGIGAIVSGKGATFGFECGAFITLVWILPVMSGTYLFANRSIKLLLIDTGMYLVLFSLCGSVLGIWQ
jgi:hypothetical protein